MYWILSLLTLLTLALSLTAAVPVATAGPLATAPGPVLTSAYVPPPAMMPRPAPAPAPVVMPRLETAPAPVGSTVVLTDAPSSVLADAPSRAKAFLLSLALPGLGHRYANAGRWDRAATLFAAADAALWFSLVRSAVRHSHLMESYETLAALRAGAETQGKDRTFFLHVGTYRSSDEFREEQLRRRAWDQVRYVDERSFQWAWQNEVDFQRFGQLQDDAESMRRRRPVIGAILVGNRLVSGLLAVRAAGRADEGDLSVSIVQMPQAPDRPALRLRASF